MSHLVHAGVKHFGEEVRQSTLILPVDGTRETDCALVLHFAATGRASRMPNINCHFTL